MNTTKLTTDFSKSPGVCVNPTATLPQIREPAITYPAVITSNEATEPITLNKKFLFLKKVYAAHGIRLSLKTKIFYSK